MQEHGGLDWRTLLKTGRKPGDILDFSVNINPFGPPPGVRKAMDEIDPAAYPDRACHEIGRMLAEFNRVEPREVIVANGTAELIWLAAHAWLPGRRAAILAPTFGEYARAAKAAGADVSLFAAEAPLFRWNMEIIVRGLQASKPALVFLCNPNNPTGVSMTEDEIRSVARSVEPGILVLDEAYRTFVSYQPFAPPPAANVLVLRSMTKDFALAGLRLGYALGPPQSIDALRSIQPPWSVNSLAQAAGVAALNDLEHVLTTCKETRRLALALRSALKRAGAHVFPSETPYCLIDVADLGGAGRVFERMLARGIQVRDCTSFGLPEFIRLGTRLPDENRRFLEVWTELYAS